MKIWIPMLILFVASLTLIVWDGIHNDNVFEYLEKESEHIYSSLLTDDISNENIQNKIHNLSNYWTKEMDMLSISISRKDMQSI